MSNINSTYFDGYYKDIWRDIIPAELTARESDFIQKYFSLVAGNRVLDLMCGYGRHTLSLARKGMEVQALDNLEDYVGEIKKIAGEEHLPVQIMQSEIMEFEADGFFDLAICMGNSLSILDRDDTVRLFEMIARHLPAGKCFLVNTWMLAEIAFNGFREKGWSQVGDLKLITESKFLLQPSRIETGHLVLAPNGKSETKKAIDYIYSIAEMETMFSQTGFQMEKVYSIPGKKTFTLGDPRAYIIARRVD